jgi:Family of unknown function (DUF6161)
MPKSPDPNSSAKSATIKIEIPEQGITQKFSKQEAIEFFDKEIQFYNRVQSLFQENFQFGNSNLGQQIHVHRLAMILLQSARNAVSNDDLSQLQKYLETARAFQHVVGQGVIGQRIELLMQMSLRTQAQWLLVLFSGREDNNSWVEPFRAIALGSPALLTFSEFAAASHARKKSEYALSKSEEAKDTLDRFIAEKMELFEQLEDLYRKKLIIEEPAISWDRVATKKKHAWLIWLSIFAALVVSPIALVIWWWQPFALAVSSLATTASGTISLSGVAAISVPALLYAWLLKNVSRVFIQNLNLADDAAHRRALAVTYLGLAENPKIQLGEAERAIVLNALFRSIPPHGTDDGPPVGLIDLIRGKSS